MDEKKSFQITDRFTDSIIKPDLIIYALPEITLYRVYDQDRHFNQVFYKEQNRLASFIKYPLDTVHPFELANNGFLYQGNGREVMCVFCRLRHGEWRSGDDVCTVHRALSAQCPMVTGEMCEIVRFVHIHSENMHSEADVDVNPFDYHSSWGDELHISNSRLVTNERMPPRVDSSTNETFGALSPSIRDNKNDQWTTNSLESNEEYENVDLPLVNQQSTRVNSSESTENTDSTMNISETMPLSYIEKYALNTNSSSLTSKSKHITRAKSIKKPLKNKNDSKYEQIKDRINSFKLMGSGTYAIKHSNLAKAGFYSANSADRVKCFSCGISIRDWLVGQDPWVEHVRNRATCQYVLQKMGQLFVTVAERMCKEKNQIISSEMVFANLGHKS